MTEGDKPAYPSEFEGGEYDALGAPVIAHRKYYGLTKREYFAAMRKEPIFGSDTMAESWAKIIMGTEIPVGPSIENIQWWISAHERFSVMRADSLIEALNNQP